MGLVVQVGAIVVVVGETNTGSIEVGWTVVAESEAVGKVNEIGCPLVSTTAV